jgi:hypothetical protein
MTICGYILGAKSHTSRSVVLECSNSGPAKSGENHGGWKFCIDESGEMPTEYHVLWHTPRISHVRSNDERYSVLHNMTVDAFEIAPASQECVRTRDSIAVDMPIVDHYEAVLRVPGDIDQCCSIIYSQPESDGIGQDATAAIKPATAVRIEESKYIWRVQELVQVASKDQGTRCDIWGHGISAYRFMSGVDDRTRSALLRLASKARKT